MNTLLKTQNLSVEIGHKSVCRNLNLSIESGQVWGVLGANGVGKTTLLHTLAGLRDASSGEIFINGNDISEMTRKKIAQHLGVLLQHIEDPFPSTVLETVIAGRHPHIANWQWENKQDYQLAHKALERVDMQNMSDRLVHNLSGGERQRVAIATLMTQNPQILLLDEPNSHLDLKYQISLLSSLCDETKEKQGALLMNIHDINLATRFCSHVVFLLGGGKILVGETADIVNPESLEALFQYPVEELQGQTGKIYVPT